MLIPSSPAATENSALPSTPLDGLPESLDRRFNEKLEAIQRSAAIDSWFAPVAFATTVYKEVKKSPAELLDHTLAYATSFSPSVPLWAAVIGKTIHLGTPHVHASRPPLPLPSIGRLKYGGCASVLINGSRAARVGDLGKAHTCLSISPFYQVTTGSSSVFIGGERAARLLDFTRHCGPPSEIATHIIKTNSVKGITKLASFTKIKKALKWKAVETALDTATKLQDADPVAIEQVAIDLEAEAYKLLVGIDPGTPPCRGVLLPLPGSVFIGGFPLPASDEIFSDLKGLGKLLAPASRDTARAQELDARLSGTYKPGRDSNALPRSHVILTGHPVDVVAGRFVLDAVDIDLPGALPIRLARAYSSTWGDRPSPLGRGWSHTLDEAVWREPGQLVYRAADGRELELPLVDRETFCPQHRLTIRPLGDGYQIEDHRGVLRDFAPTTAAADLHRLLKIHDRHGHRVDLEYHDSRLVHVHAPDGRELRLHYHDDGHLARLDVPDPDSPALVPHVHYAYAGDDLVAITDALGHVTRYRLDNHRIVEETLPNGLRFHFEYDGPGTDAACTRTHGDGGIIDHTLLYDRPRRTTLVTNACKETAIVRHGPRGEPLAVTDARGATTHHEYDVHLRRTATTDPLGRVTRHEYDARGNCTRTVTPDGATTTVEYDRDLPVAATDPAGGRWRWSYDASGRLVRRTDPLGRTTTYQHTATTTAVTHPDGRRDLRTYDLAGALLRVDLADGRVLQHTYDRRGRRVRTFHPDGTIESFTHDLLDRPTRHVLPGGDTRHFNYDDLGNLVRVCDARTDLRCTYTGLRWLASVGDATAAPFTLERDLEGRVIRVADQAGTLLHIERDAGGQPRTITDARGRRRLTRDLTGRVLTTHAAGETTTYTRDLAGRVTRVDHPDRTRDEFIYRLDGALLGATRHHPDATTTVVRRELDACARLLREWQDDRWISATRDLHDRITLLRSSAGPDLRLTHDDRGLARVALTDSPWSIAHERDPHGRETARQLPGGVTCWWHRDPAGRPVEHGVTGSQPPQIHRHRRYTWTPGGQLSGQSDLTARPRARAVQLAPVTTCPESQPHSSARHDPLGRCIARSDTRWQWFGATPIHTITPADTATWIFAADVPIARLASTARHTIVTAPDSDPLIFDEHGALSTRPLDLPDPAPLLDIFGRPRTTIPPALARVTAELAHDLPDEPTPPADREAAVLAAVFRTPPTIDRT